MFLHSILTIMHMRLSHPALSQLQKIFEHYFIAFGVRAACTRLSSNCSLCTTVKSFPMDWASYSQQPIPLHPGSHINIDVMRRAAQFVIVNVDRFSALTTAAIIASESRGDLCGAILAVMTPIRHSSRVMVRTDRAPALQSLATRPEQ